MTPENIKLYKQNIVRSLGFEMYRNEIDHARAVNNLLEIEKEGDLPKIDEQIKGLKAELEALSDSKKKEDRMKRKRLELDLSGTQFLRSQLSGGRNKLFKEVLEYGKKNAAIQAEIDFTNSFELGQVPQLPYIEIDDTRYQATKDNKIVLDAEGNMSLYLAPVPETIKDVKDTNDQKDKPEVASAK